MAKAIRKNLEDIALPAVPKATPGLNIPIDFWRGKKGADVYCLSDNFQAYKFKQRKHPGLWSLLLIDCASPPWMFWWQDIGSFFFQINPPTQPHQEIWFRWGPVRGARQRLQPCLRAAEQKPGCQALPPSCSLASRTPSLPSSSRCAGSLHGNSLGNPPPPSSSPRPGPSNKWSRN